VTTPESNQPVIRDRPGCADARAGMRAFVAGTQPANPPPAWREHMSACTRCTLEYHELVTSVARLARGVTQPSASLDTDVYGGPGPEERVRRSLIAADARNRVRLPKLLLPVAVVGLLVMALSRSSVPHPMLRSLSGAVTRAGTAIDSAAPVAVARGDACTTAPRSRAQLEFGTSWIRFDAESSFLVDRTDKLAVRFFAGNAEIQGDALLLLPSCAVEVHEGSAEIEITTGQLTIRCNEGSVTRTDGGGRFVILPGEATNLLFDAPAKPATPDPVER
jgi:hypothetical protein